MLSPKKVVFAVLGLSALACGTSDPGASGAGGGSAHAGAGGAGGSNSSAPSAGATSMGGGAATAGSGNPGLGGGGSGGANVSGGAGGLGGSAGAGATGGSGGAGAPAVPSAGCGKSGRPANGEVNVAGEHIYDFPDSYDGQKPMPLVIGFHANSNPDTQIQGLTNGTRLASQFIRAFPKSAGAGWVLGTDAPRVAKMYDELLANYCIDTSRVFATGHSSGAQMVVQLLCTQNEKRFKAVAPVAASKYCNSLPPIPVMYIQGMVDAQRGNSNGADVVQLFTSSNHCSSTTVPDNDVGTCNSTFDKALVTPGCVTYQGCTVPTIWCSHNDNGYNATDGHMHGWPCFASNAMADFFISLH